MEPELIEVECTALECIGVECIACMAAGVPGNVRAGTEPGVAATPIASAARIAATPGRRGSAPRQELPCCDQS